MIYKNLKISILITGGLFLISGFLFYQNSAAYSDTTTHPDLSREIISFYELSTGKKFTDEQKQWIIQGSKDEDKAPRWINHFYDPVFERGLQAESIGISGYLAKNWAQYSSYQSLNPENIANLWTGKGPVISGSWWGDFSYEAAIKDYSKDKEKEAYIALGHILHLIEDMTVPEHTRNDPHPGGDLPSYYENWTKDNSSGLTQDLGKRIYNQGRKPVIYTDLENYFNNIAAYTNNYFFSPRTINSGLYQKPKIVYEDETFAYGKDENNEIFDLAVINEKSSYRKTYEIKDENNQVLQEYWLRLSRQAVINGAGVIGLFLNQATAARDAELAKQKMEAQQLAKKSSFISQIINFFRSPNAPTSEPALIITSELTPAAPKIIKSAPKPVPAQVITPAPPSTAVSAPAPAPKPAPKPQNQSPQSNPPMVYGSGGGSGGGGSTPSANSGQVALATSGGGSVSNSNTQQTTNDTQQTTQQNNQTSDTSENSNVQTFKTGDLVINEIMYDLEGSDTSSGKSREWVEVYNNSGREIALTGGNSGWRFSDGSNHLLNEPAAQGSMTIPAGGYAILAGDAATFLIDHPGFGGTVIDTVMSLKNTSATLKISSPDGVIIDEVTYNSSWGASGNGKTLERKSAAGGSNDAANWSFSSANGGTPGAVNNWFIATLGLGTDVSATTTITTNTTWTLAGSPYRLFFDGTRRPTVSAGAILTIEPGVKIIPQGGNYTAMEIQGTLNAIATSGAPIIFTSKNDADPSTGSGQATPQKGDWLNIAFSPGSQVNMDYVEFRYGGQGITLPLHEMVNIVGAMVNIKNSKFSNSQSTALHLMDSSGVIENSVFSDNNCGISADSINGVANTAYGGCYGVHTSGQIFSSTALEIKNNQFIRNQFIGVEVRSGAAPTVNSNIFTDNGYPIKIESSYPTITNSQIVNSTPSTSSGQATSTFLGGIAISGYTHFHIFLKQTGRRFRHTLMPELL
ncbi:MAG: lamin tail domain-containing protein [Parcubacteria group bacterium]|nr:lamin tail domain-containing protein [Parcubacteria group bacterium]